MVLPIALWSATVDPLLDAVAPAPRPRSLRSYGWWRCPSCSWPL
ncbi:hypothetical protein NKG94_31070 [Micromonospora sp. M12]